jgi:hypothetical protein
VSTLTRRKFLQLTGLATVAAVVGVPFGAAAASAGSNTGSSGGKLYRGDRRGHIYVSADGGTTWALHTFLGKNYNIRRMATDRRGRLNAKIDYRTGSFKLALAQDGDRWLLR